MFSEEKVAAIVGVAHSAGMEPAALLAVVEIESRGEPFESWDGKTPRFLFEKHIFLRQLRKFASRDAIMRATAENLVAEKWRKKVNYVEQGTAVGRKDILQRARAIDVECANLSCSWGVGQIMGFNAKDLGYSSATQMVQEMSADGRGFAAQVESIVRFVRSKNIQSALANHNWTAFAVGYNGKGQAENQYDAKLAQAYKRWKSRVLPAPGALPTIPPTPDQVVNLSFPWRRGARGTNIEELQKALEVQGHPVGEKDGIFGPLTEKAIFAFQAANGLATTGELDEQTHKKLFAGQLNAAAEKRKNVTQEDLRNLGSKTIAETDFGKKISYVLGAIGGGGLIESIFRGTSDVTHTTTLTSVAQNVSDAAAKATEVVKTATTQPAGTVSPLQGIIDAVIGTGGPENTLAVLVKAATLLIQPSHGLPVVAGAAALLLWRSFRKVEALRVEDHAKGFNTAR
jgi:hypothetical protein